MTRVNRLVFGALAGFAVLFVAFFIFVADASAADRYWIGTSVSDSWSSTDYWSTSSGGASGASVPGAGDNAIFDSNSSSATMPAGDMTLNGLDIQATYPGGNTVTLTTGTLKATDAFRHAAGTMDTNGGTVQFGDNETNQFQLNSDVTVNDFIFNKASGWQVDMNGYTLTVNGDTTRTNGTFDETGTVVFKGDVVINNTDLFNATTTIEFAAGTTQTFTNNGLTANDSFRGPFTVNTANTVVELAGNDIDTNTAGVLTVSDGTFDMNGVSMTGLNNILIDGGTLTHGSGTLQATTSTNAFRITSGTYDGGGTGTLDLNASQGTETAIDGGTFNAPAVLEIARDFNLSTTATFNHMNGLVTSGVNGGSYEVEGGAGTIRWYDFTLNMPGWTADIDAATTLVVEGTFTWTDGGFRDDSSATNPFQLEGNADIDIADTSGMVEMYITGSGTQTLDFATVGSWDSDVIVNKSGGSVSLLTGMTLDQASMNSLTIEEGTFDINGQALTVDGTFSVEDGGNFQMAGTESPPTPTLASGSTVTYDATSGSNAIKDYGYHHLAFNGSGGTFTMHAGGETVAGNLTITAGKFDLDGNDLTVTGTFSNDDTLQLEGGETTASLTMDTDSGMVTYKGDGSTAYSSLKLGSSYYNLTFNNSGNSWGLSGALDVDGALNVNAGVLDTGTDNVNVAGNWTVGGTGVYQAGSNTTTFDGTSGTQTIITGGTGVNNDFNDVVINNSGTAVELSTNAIDIDGTLTITAGTIDISGQGLTATTGFSNDGNFQLEGGETVAVPGMDTDSGTVTYDGSGSYTPAGGTFYNLTFNGSGTWTHTGNLDVDSVLTISAGTVDLAGYDLNVQGNYAKTGGTFTSGSNTTTFDGTSGTQTINTGGTTTGDDFNDVVINNSGTAVQLITNDMDVDGTFTLTSGTFDLNAQNLTIVSTISNSGTFLLEGGETVTLTAGMDTSSGAVKYDGTGTYASGLAAGDSYYDLTFDGSGGSWTLDATLDVDGDFLITNGTVATGGSNITVAENFTNNGTFTHGGALVTLDGAAQTLAGSTTFNDLSKTVASAATLTLTAGDTFTIANDLTWQGASGQLLTVESSSSGTAANVSVAGTPTVSYLSVKDANNTGSTILCVTGCTNVSGNTGWIFASAATPSSIIYEDNDSDGTVDRILARFASNVGITGTVSSTRLTLVSASGANGFGGSLSGNASVSGTDVIITIASAEAGETSASTAPTLAYDDNSDDSTNYITDVNGDMIQTFTATSATDGAAPVYSSAEYQDTDSDGDVDTVEITWSEAIATNAGSVGDFTYVANDLTSSDLTGGSNGGETAAAMTLTLGTSGPANTTSHTTAPTLAYTFSSGAIADSAGNQAVNFTAQNLSDGAAPLLVSSDPANDDANVSKNDDITLTFSEPITTASFTYTCCGSGTDPGSRVVSWSSGDTVATIAHAQFQSSDEITIDVTAAPDASSNSFGGAIAATAADPYTFTTQASGGVTVGVNDGNIAGGSTINPTLTLASPNGGETYAPGEEVSIGWTQQGRVDMVNVLFSPDNGSTWETIANATRNLGYITWTVPHVISDLVRIKVEATDLASIYAQDSSDAPITISAADGIVARPGNDEVQSTPGQTVALMLNTEGEEVTLSEGSLFRGVELSGVYRVQDGKRYVFPNEATFFSYGYSFDDVINVQDDQLRILELGRRMRMAPDSMIKVQSDDRVFQVQDDGTMRHVSSEAVAEALYGANWNRQITDISVAFWGDYTIGLPIEL